MIKAKRCFAKSLNQLVQRGFSDNFMSEANSLYAEQMYSQWLQDNKSVHTSWNAYFSNISRGIPSDQAFISPEEAAKNGFVIGPSQGKSNTAQMSLFNKISRMIYLFRSKGHYMAKLDPLGIMAEKLRNRVGNDYFTEFESGISESEYDTKIDLSGLGKVGFHTMKLEWSAREVYDHLKKIYSEHIGIQYMHISNSEVINWIQDRIEKHPIFKKSRDEKLRLLDKILESQSFNTFCERKYSTYKRFGCEGLDSGISGMGKLVETAARHQIDETIIGMSHRGRLNILCCVLRKPYNQIFAEFEDITYNPEYKEVHKFTGDVKYHIGCSNKLKYENGHEMVINLLPNPSHLEAVYPVCLGTARARQSKLNDTSGKKVLPVIIHGDAALTGQGVIYETQQMEKLEHFTVGGTLHIVFNNQLGFTTDPVYGRSGYYPTNIAKINNNPVIHVNADMPEEVDFAFEMAVDYRMKFSGDIYINLVGYRRFGHNEQDNAQFTQPEMFEKIQKQPHMYTLYGKQLEKEGVITKDYFDKRLDHYTKKIEDEHKRTLAGDIQLNEWDPYGWNEIKKFEPKKTGISLNKMLELGKTINTLPESMNLHRTIKKLYAERLQNIINGNNIDWATAEALAYASLLDEKHSVRLSGEDSERGTFAHRHAVIHDLQTFKKYTPIQAVVNGKSEAKFEIVNSLLSEYGVLGFEYGHSIAQPHDLTIWEAQFGDFINGAQIIVDQFLNNGEKKWLKKSSIVLLLPHGADGQGPEHSNARLERFLQNVDDDFTELTSDKKVREKRSEKVNVLVLNITNPANFFHALRRQVNTRLRKPMIVFSPKKLLKHKLVRSEVSEFLEDKEFIRVYDETEIPHDKVDRILICSGQIYFDLLEYRQEHKIDNVAIIRMEQIGPFPYNAFNKVIAKYPNKKAKITWVSEEHRNFGAFDFIEPRMNIILKEEGFGCVDYVGRPISSTSATGSSKQHKLECAKILKEAFA